MRMIIRAFAGVMVAVLSASAAEARDRFDLDCTGTLRGVGDVAPLAFEQRMSIDLVARRWCSNLCAQPFPVLRSDATTLVLVERSGASPSDPVHQKAVDLATGRMTEATSTGLGGSPVTVAAKCTIGAFTGIGPSEEAKSAPRLATAAVTSRDYPPAALRNERRGRTAFKAMIAADGRPLDCRIADSSGSADLDYRTCDMVLTRFRFMPAVDAKGRAMAANYLGSLNWALP